MIQIAKFIMGKKEGGRPTMVLTSIRICVDVIVVDVKQLIIVALVVHAAMRIHLTGQKECWKVPF